MAWMSAWPTAVKKDMKSIGFSDQEIKDLESAGSYTAVVNSPAMKKQKERREKAELIMRKAGLIK